jgi:hypothetical protein
LGIIKNINLNEIESNLKEIVGLSFQIKLFEEEYEDVANQLKTSKANFSSGGISRDVYNKNKTMLENESKRLIKKINETVERTKNFNGNVQKTIKENVI